MKRILFILNALFFAILVHADDYTTVTHNFKTAMTPPRTMEILSGNKVGRMSDGTVYTCYGTATFFDGDDILWGTGICIKIPKNNYVIVSPPRERLSHMTFSLISGSGYGSLDVYVSPDNSTWTAVPIASSSEGNVVTVTAALFGNYYVKLVGKTNDAYLKTSIYYSHPDCGCFPYIPEE